MAVVFLSIFFIRMDVGVDSQQTFAAAVAPRVGWVSPDERYSSNILFGCLGTLVACSWSILQLNLPGLDKSSWGAWRYCPPYLKEKHSLLRQFRRKLKWTVFTLAVPELIAIIAVTEIWMAINSRKSIKELGGKHWTLVHGCYANMGGFILRSPGLEPFPLNSEALVLLVREKIIDIPDVKEYDILDRSKLDFFSRIFAVLQVGWFSVQCIARWSSNLRSTPLEILTFFVVIISIFTFFLEWFKPKDVNVPLYVECPHELDDAIVCRISDIYKRMYGNKFADIRSISRIPYGAVWRHLYSDGVVLPLWVIVLRQAIPSIGGVYNGFHYFGLAFRPDLFPNHTLLTVWKGSAILGMAIPFAAFVLTLLIGTIERKLDQNLVRQLSRAVVGVLLFFYWIARIVPFILASVCFYSLPGAVYKAIVWTDYIPHF